MFKLGRSVLFTCIAILLVIVLCALVFLMANREDSPAADHTSESPSTSDASQKPSSTSPAEIPVPDFSAKEAESRIVIQQLADSFLQHQDAYSAIAFRFSQLRADGTGVCVRIAGQLDYVPDDIRNAATELCQITGIEYSSISCMEGPPEGYSYPANSCVFEYTVPCVLNGKDTVYCWVDLVYSSDWEAYLSLLRSVGEGYVDHLIDIGRYIPLTDEWGVLINYAY